MSMIERVARAVADGNWDAKDFCETPNGEEPEEFRAYWREKARAALEAMMEPTFEILRAGMNTKDNGDGQLHRRKWQAMLQAALHGDKEG